MSEDRKAMRLTCRACNHVWDGCLLPIEIDKFVKIMRQATCPSCAAGSREIFCAPNGPPRGADLVERPTPTAGGG